MNRRRIDHKTLTQIEKTLSNLPHPLRVEREGKGLVKVLDEEGNFIQLPSYVQLPSLLLFIKKNCPHADK